MAITDIRLPGTALPERSPRNGGPALPLSLTLLLLATLTGCVRVGPPPPPAAPVPVPVEQDPVEGLVEGFLGFHLYFNPVQATRLGAPGYEERLPDVSVDGMTSRIPAYREWLSRVEAIDVRGVGLDQEMDLRVVQRAVRLALIEAEMEPWRRNPLFHARLIREALEPLVGNPDLSEDDQLVALASRQRQFSTVLAEARSSLSAPPRLLVEQAIGEIEGTVTWLRRDLPSRYAGAPEAQPKWGFERSNAAAISELESFLVFLREELLPGANGELALGAAVVDLLVSVAGLAPDGATLLEQVEQEVTRLGRWVDAEAGRLGGSGPPSAALDRLDAQRLPGDSVLPVARHLSLEVREFLDRRSILPLPAGEAEVRPVPLTRPAEAVRLDHAGRLSPRWHPVLFLDPLGAGRPVTRETVEAGVLREGLPGRLLLLETSAWVGRPVRLALPAPGEEAGWGLHAVGLLLDQGFRGGEPVLRIAQLRDRLRILARLRAGLRFHRGEWTLDQAVHETARSTRLSEDVARRLVSWNLHDPLEGAAGIQALRYEELRNGLLDRPLQAGGPLSLDTALTVILAAGLSPDLARDLLLPPPPS